MLRKTLFTVVLTFLAFNLNAAQARNYELVDVLTANSLLQGEVRVDIKLYPGGGILSRLYIGVFDALTIGGAFNTRNIVGTGDIEFVMPPKLLGKFRITSDEGAVPAIAVGYEGESYMDVGARGLYFSVTKEMALSSAVFFQLTGSVYTNEFSRFGSDINLAGGIAFAITREFTFSIEYDGLFDTDKSHLNFGLGYFFDPIEIDLGIKYGLGREDIRLGRILRIIYISYF